MMAYAPDAFSSYVYAGVAARAAWWLQAHNSAKSATYRQSALRAMDWAEKDRNREEREFLMGKHPAIRDARNYAAAEVFRLTGESRWNEVFVATTEFANPTAPVPFHWDALDQADAAWVYARTNRHGMDKTIKRNCRAVLIREAETRVASVERTGFRWAKHPYAPVVMGVLSSPEEAVNVVRAHVLSGDLRFLRAAVLACHTGAGANPVNMCYTTGLGQKSPRHPLQIDHRITHQPPPPGITVGGPMDNTMNGLKDPFIRPFAGAVIFPPVEQWPALEAYWDVFWDPMVCEYTVHKPMAGNAYVWGYLAARPKQAKGSEKQTSEPLSRLHAKGTMLVDATDKPVLLRGVNLGGWLVEEMWMMPFQTSPPQGSKLALVRTENLFEDKAMTTAFREGRSKLVEVGRRARP